MIVVFAGAWKDIWGAKVVTIEKPFTSTQQSGEWNVHIFDLIRHRGAELRLSKCPGPKCFFFRLDDQSVKDGVVVQKFTLGGDALGVIVRPEEVSKVRQEPFFEMQNMTALRGGAIVSGPLTTDLHGWIVLDIMSRIYMCSKLYDLQIRTLSITVQALKLDLLVKTGTWHPGKDPEKCAWIQSELRSFGGHNTGEFRGTQY